MKKIIFIFLSLISISVYGQPCAGITSTGTVKSKTFKSCYDSVLVTSVLNTVIADTVTVTKLTATGAISASNLSGTNTGDQTTISGNAGTATALQTARNINGVSFNGTADITVTSSAGTLTGTTLNSSVVNSSLTSVGTLSNLTVTNPISGSVTGNAATVTTNANLTGAVTSSGNATSLGSFTSANLSGALTNEVGTGLAVFATSPSLVTPTIDAATGTSLILNQNISQSNWTTSGVRLVLAPRRITNATSSGTVATVYNNYYAGDTSASTSNTTYTNFYNHFYDLPQVDATHLTMTNMYTIGINGTIQVQSGRIKFTGSNCTIGTMSVDAFSTRTNDVNRTTWSTTGLQSHAHTILTTGTTPSYQWTQPANSGGSAGIFLITAGSLTSQTTATEVTDIDFNLSATLKSVDGTIPLNRSFRIRGRTITPQTTSLTVTDAVNLNIESLTAGSGTTFTRNWNTRFLGNGMIGVGGKLYVGDNNVQTAATALVNIAAGTSAANTAPVKLTSGTNLTTPESGAVEYDGTNFYVTNSTPTRLTVDGSLRGSATLNFPSISPQSTQTLTITVTGAADGDIIAGLGVPSAANVTNVVFTAQVTSSNTVTVTAWNFDTVSARDPASATFKVAVIK